MLNNIKFVQSSSNFAKFSKMKNKQIAFPEVLETTPFRFWFNYAIVIPYKICGCFILNFVFHAKNREIVERFVSIRGKA